MRLNPRRLISTKNQGLNLREICLEFKKYEDIFLDFKCSEKLGIATFKYLNKLVIITKMGKLRVQQAANEQDLVETFEFVIDLLVKNDILSENWENQ